METQTTPTLLHDTNGTMMTATPDSSTATLGVLTDGTAPQAWARGLTKVYGSGETAVTALDGIDVDFASGRFTAIAPGWPGGSTCPSASTIATSWPGTGRPIEPGLAGISEAQLETTRLHSVWP